MFLKLLTLNKPKIFNFAYFYILQITLENLYLELTKLTKNMEKHFFDGNQEWCLKFMRERKKYSFQKLEIDINQFVRRKSKI